MPRNFGPVHITCHRGEWIKEHQTGVVKKLTGHTKDDVLPTLERTITPRPAPRGKLPTLSIQRTTDFTRFPTSRALGKAIDRQSVVVHSAAEVIRTVRQHIDQKLAARQAASSDQQRPLVVLVGDSHRSKTALMLTLSAIEMFKGQDATLLLELCSEEADDVKAMAADLAGGLSSAPLEAATFNQRVANMLEGTDPGTTEPPALCKLGLTTLCAAKARADVGHFDSARAVEHSTGPMDLKLREDMMVDNLQRAAQASSGPVIVQAGALHLPALAQGCAGQFDVLALTIVVDAFGHLQLPDDKRRASFLLSNKDILRVRRSPAIERQPFDTAAFFRQLGMDPGARLPAALQGGSPWERPR